MIEIIWVFMAHFVGDIALQSDWQAQNKGKYWYVLLSHSIIWTTCICIALVFIGRFQYYDIPILVGGHMACDLIKARQPKNDGTWWQIYPDQAFHFFQLLVVYLL